MRKSSYFFYNALLVAAGAAALPFFVLRAGKYRKSLKQKLGVFEDGYFPGKKRCRIWVHAVSVGEVTGASPVIKELKRILPEAGIVVSTGTVSGQDAARRMLSGMAEAFFYYPLDFPFSARKTADKAAPDIFILSESEIWPGILWILKKRGVKLFLINGRMSGKSFRLYYTFRFFWGGVLKLFDCIAMASERDYRRMLLLGAEEGRIKVAGNSKYDALEENIKEEHEEEMRGLYTVKAEESVFILASLHPGEFRMAASACLRLKDLFPSLLFIAAPRHPRRSGRLAGIFREYGLECRMRSSVSAGTKRRGEPVIIVDVIGELFKLYSLGSVVFCGGSLVPKGGQNILEPAAWGRPVIFGPYMEDFEDERDLLKGARAGFSVAGGGELAEAAAKLISNPAEAAEAGARGKEAVFSRTGAAREIASIVMEEARRG